jgi:hypothetical protein
MGEVKKFPYARAYKMPLQWRGGDSYQARIGISPLGGIDRPGRHAGSGFRTPSAAVANGYSRHGRTRCPYDLLRLFTSVTSSAHWDADGLDREGEREGADRRLLDHGSPWPVLEGWDDAFRR